MSLLIIAKFIDILPIFASIIILRYCLKVKGGSWQDKVLVQIGGSRFKREDQQFIISVVEDIYTSLGFIGEASIIIVGSIVVVMKNYISRNDEVPLFIINFEVLFLIMLLIVYLITSINIYRMKLTLVDRKVTSRLFCKSTYEQIYDNLLKLGYVFLGVISLEFLIFSN